MTIATDQMPLRRAGWISRGAGAAAGLPLSRNLFIRAVYDETPLETPGHAPANAGLPKGDARV
jgi:hypothetical protein